MIPRELLGTAIVPGGGEELLLFRRGKDFMIVLDRNELMNSRMSGSEEALATMTIERLGNCDGPLLIGGYGMGFTLRASCESLAPTGKMDIRAANGGSGWKADIPPQSANCRLCSHR